MLRLVDQKLWLDPFYSCTVIISSSLCISVRHFAVISAHTLLGPVYCTTWQYLHTLETAGWFLKPNGCNPLHLLTCVRLIIRNKRQKTLIPVENKWRILKVLLTKIIKLSFIHFLVDCWTLKYQNFQKQCWFQFHSYKLTVLSWITPQTWITHKFTKSKFDLFFLTQAFFWLLQRKSRSKWKK